MFSEFSKYWRQLTRARPGERFTAFHDRNHVAGKSSAIERMVRVILMLACTVLGVVLVLIPGPAIPFLLIAGSLLAIESRGVAVVFDRGEMWARAGWIKGRRHWRRLPALRKVAIAGLVLSGTCGATYLSYRLFVDS